MKLNVQNSTTQIKLGDKIFNAKLDFLTIANIQKQLKKDGQNCTFQEMFEGIANQDFSILVPFLVQSIKRVHPQLKDDYIVDFLNFENIEAIFEGLSELIEASMPKETDKKK